MTLHRWLAILLGAHALVSCTGSVGDTLPSDDGPGKGGTGTGGTGGAQGAGPPSPDTGLQRLTRTEYNNTLRDLLGDTQKEGNRLDVDPIPSGFGFDKNATLLASVPPDPEKYDAIATDVVENAFRAGSPGRARLMSLGGCGSNSLDVTCARNMVSAFTRKAWRRRVASDEIESLMTAAMSAQADGTEEVVKLAFRMVLTSPSFLYRVEIDPSDARGLHALSGDELAVRLSYFLWSSMPDDELFAHVDADDLRKPDVFAKQVARMLNDPKGLVDDFASQWLGVRGLGNFSPDAKTYRTSINPTIPNDWSNLRDAMLAETQSFFAAFLKDGKVTDMLDANFTFANARLAKHYNLAGVTGTEVRQVSLTSGGQRFGLLSQASILTATSNPNRTNVPRRGKWVLSRLLCSPPPEPPAKVPALELAKVPANATARDQLAVHRQDPACAGCHATFDPIGFGLENYNGIGGWRDAYAGGVHVDSSGKISGTDFKGPRELSQALATDPQFTRCVAKSLFSYALGRDPTSNGDLTTVDNLDAGYMQRGGLLPELVREVVSSRAFTFRGGVR